MLRKKIEQLCDNCGGFCCSLEVTLSKSEIKTIAQKIELNPDNFVTCDNTIERKQGVCIFYDKGCKIYAIRPQTCKKICVQRIGFAVF